MSSSQVCNEVIESRFGIVVVASIPQGVHDCHGAGLGIELAPGVVAVVGYNCAGGIYHLHDVPLEIQDVVVGGEAASTVGGTPEDKGSAVVVTKFGSAALCPKTA